jgi:hypothetical protein
VNISTRRLSYVLKSKTQIAVSKITGIPQSTISRVKNGQIPLPSKYSSTLRNYYQKTAYGDLRDSGASATQARRFSWYVPEKVTDVVSTLNDTKDMLSAAWVARQRMKSDELWSSEDYEDARLEAEQTILESMRKSKKTIEDIYGSGKKSIWTI